MRASIVRWCGIGGTSTERQSPQKAIRAACSQSHGCRQGQARSRFFASRGIIRYMVLSVVLPASQPPMSSSARRARIGLMRRGAGHFGAGCGAGGASLGDTFVDSSTTCRDARVGVDPRLGTCRSIRCGCGFLPRADGLSESSGEQMQSCFGAGALSDSERVAGRNPEGRSGSSPRRRRAQRPGRRRYRPDSDEPPELTPFDLAERSSCRTASC